MSGSMLAARLAGTKTATITTAAMNAATTITYEPGDHTGGERSGAGRLMFLMSAITRNN